MKGSSIPPSPNLKSSNAARRSPLDFFTPPISYHLSLVQVYFPLVNVAGLQTTRPSLSWVYRKYIGVSNHENYHL